MPPEMINPGTVDMFGKDSEMVGQSDATAPVKNNDTAPATTGDNLMAPGTVAMYDQADRQEQAQAAMDNVIRKAREAYARGDGDEYNRLMDEVRQRSLAEKSNWAKLAKQYADERTDTGTHPVLMELRAAMEGKRESAAAEMLRQQSQTVARQQIGQAYARAANPAVVRAAIMAGTEAQQTAASNAAVMRAQEQDNARAQWANAYLSQQAQLAQLQIQSMGGAMSAEQLYQQALYAQAHAVESSKNKEFEIQMQNLRFEQQKQLAQIGYEWQQAQQEAARDEALIPSMFQGAIGGAAAGSVAGPVGAVVGAGVGAFGAYAVNRNSSSAAPSYGYGQMATTTGASALQYKAQQQQNAQAAAPTATTPASAPSTESALRK